MNKKEMVEKRQIFPIDIRKVFEKGKKNNNLMVRGLTETAEFFWDTGMIFADSLTKTPEQRKIN